MLPIVNPHYANRQRISFIRKVIFVGITVVILVALLYITNNSVQPIDSQPLSSTADRARRLGGDQVQGNDLDPWTMLGLTHGASQDAINIVGDSLGIPTAPGDETEESKIKQKRWNF